MLLSDAGQTAPKIAALFGVRTRTIHTWMNRWASLGIVGLMILPGRGVKSKLKINDSNLVDLVKKATQYARSLNGFACALSKELGFKVTRHMLRRFLKRLGYYGWKRFRKSLKKEQDEQQYRRKLAELKDLIKLNQQGYIDLFYSPFILCSLLLRNSTISAPNRVIKCYIIARKP